MRTTAESLTSWIFSPSVFTAAKMRTRVFLPDNWSLIVFPDAVWRSSLARKFHMKLCDTFTHKSTINLNCQSTLNVTSVLCQHLVEQIWVQCWNWRLQEFVIVFSFADVLLLCCQLNYHACYSPLQHPQIGRQRYTTRAGRHSYRCGAGEQMLGELDAATCSLTYRFGHWKHVSDIHPLARKVYVPKKLSVLSLKVRVA